MEPVSGPETLPGPHWRRNKKNRNIDRAPPLRLCRSGFFWFWKSYSELSTEIHTFSTHQFRKNKNFEALLFKNEMSSRAMSPKLSCSSSLLMLFKNNSNSRGEGYLWITCFLFFESATYPIQKHVEPTGLLLHPKWGQL